MKLLGAARQPFLGVALAAAAGIAGGDFVQLSQRSLVVTTAIAAGCAILLLWRPNVLFTYLFVFCSFLLLHELRTIATPGLTLADRLGERPRMITVTGAVVSEPKVAGNGKTTFLLHLSSVDLEGRTESTEATILVRGRSSPAFGDELRLFGMAAPIAPPRNPGEFDMRSYFMRRDVRRILFVRYPEDGTLIRSGGGNPILRVAQQSRKWLQTALCRGLDDAPEVRNFISGITLGLRHQTPEDIEEPFQQTGTLHLFAVAGLHVGMVAELLWIITNVVRLSRRWAAVAIIPLVLFYAAVTGLHISSVRAAVMSAVLMGGFVVERKVFVLNSLAAAAVLLLAWNTNELFSTGFQLSFAVVGTIVLLVNPLTTLFRRHTAPDPFLPRTLIPRYRRIIDPILRKFGQGAAVSVAAWVGSLVLLFWYFHLATPISLVANLVVVPIAFCILAIALLSIGSAPFLPWVSIVFNNANWLLARMVIAIVQLFAHLPAGHYYLPHPPGLGNAVAKLTVLDVGAGAAVHLQTRDQQWLFDCGSERDYGRLVREYLHTAGVNKLDGLVLSHGDSQHIGGAGRLLSEIRPKLLIDNPAADKSSVHKRLRRMLDERKWPVTRPTRGDVLQIGPDVTCAVIHPSPVFSSSISDDQALVLRLEIRRGPTILLMSDSGLATEKALVDSAIPLRSDIIIKGQHHSGKSGSTELLQAVQPQLIVATSRDFPQHERIDDQWADQVRSRNIKLFKQSDTGAVQIWLRPDGWEARAYVTGETFRSVSR
jgi:competence protein ComEC